MHRRAVYPLALVLLLALLTLTNHPSRRSPHSPPPEVPPTLAGQEMARSGRQANATPDPVAPHQRPPTPLLDALYHGQAVSISVGAGDRESRFVFRQRRSLADDFGITLGTGHESLETDPVVFEGLALSPGDHGTTATLAHAGDAIGALLRQATGEVTYIRTHPESGELQAQTESAAQLDTHCAWDASAGQYQMSSDAALPHGEGFWENAAPVEITPETAALTGLDPATDRLDKYINRIPRATRYDASLKDALLLLVLDKDATGPSTTSNLTSKASLFLATISNVAAAYENQLGIRLLVQEMIMIPDEDDYTDIPSGGIEDFRDWIQTNRRNSIYRWSMATKFGAGLEGQTLGVAFVRAIRNTSAVSVCRSTARWDVLAHEIGHNLGSEHSQGGLMNSSSLGGSNRNFFTDVSPGETSAKDIYDYAGLGTRLYGPADLRHPEEIPFAIRDSESTPRNTPVTLSPLSNDNEQVRNGEANTLALDEVSEVIPAGAGTVDLLGNDLRFTPTEDFEGTAWFSYSLKGNVGNDGEGWLHKGDIAIQVGAASSPLTIELAPGASYSFVPAGGTGALSQPDQATVDRSRDDSTLLIIRVQAEASGSDTFRAGGRTYTLNYTAPSPRVTNDRYVYDVKSGGLVFNPLLNDEGAGEPWINPIKPSIGVGTFNQDTDGDELFPTTFRLVSVTNRTPEKGTVSTRTLPFVNDGELDNRLDSTLTFTAKSGASGLALLDYTVADAAGVQSTGEIEIVLPFRIDTLVSTGDTARFHIPVDAAVDSTWMLPEFDDSAWSSGATGLGYDTNADFLPEIATTIDGLRDTGTSLYVRIPFEAEDVVQFSNMALRMKVDDGFLAYLNGVEVARSSNVPGESPLPWNAPTNQNADDSQALSFASFDLSDSVHLLRENANVLAIQGINGSLTSSDFLLVPELEASVTSSGIVLLSPSSPEIAFPMDTWLGLQAQPTGAVTGGTVSWEVIDGPAESVLFDDATGPQSGVRFTLPGTYTLLGSASANGVTASVELIVRALPPGEAVTASAAATIELGGDRTTTQVATMIEATLTPPDVTSINWTQLNGPAQALISDPSSAQVTIATTADGDYRFRISVNRQGITTFEDLLLQVSIDDSDLSNIAALVTPASSIEATSATLTGSAFISGSLAEATFFLGRTDGGSDPSAWDRTLPLGPVGSTDLTVEANDLLFETAYYYRLRLSTGETSVWSDAESFETTASLLLHTTVIDETTTARVRVATDDSTAANWRATDFDDSSWTEGLSRVGYDLDTEFLPWIQTDIQEAMYTQTTSVFIRLPFEINDLRSVESFALRIRYDDAFIAYLNGEEIARSATAPQSGELTWETAAAILRDDTEAVELENYDLSEHLDLLQGGRNVLAIHGLNFIPENRDLLIAPELHIERRQTYYQNWLAPFALTGNEAAPGEDPDGDGYSNLYEYALGGDPTAPNTVADLEPRWERAPDGTLLLTYTQRTDAAARGLEVMLEHSADLISWQNEVNPAVTVTSLGPLDEIRLSLAPRPDELSRYWRLRMTME